MAQHGASPATAQKKVSFKLRAEDGGYVSYPSLKATPTEALEGHNRFLASMERFAENDGGQKLYRLRTENGGRLSFEEAAAIPQEALRGHSRFLDVMEQFAEIDVHGRKLYSLRTENGGWTVFGQAVDITEKALIANARFETYMQQFSEPVEAQPGMGERSNTETLTDGSQGEEKNAGEGKVVEKQEALGIEQGDQSVKDSDGKNASISQEQEEKKQEDSSITPKALDTMVQRLAQYLVTALPAAQPSSSATTTAAMAETSNTTAVTTISKPSIKPILKQTVYELHDTDSEPEAEDNAPTTPHPTTASSKSVSTSRKQKRDESASELPISKKTKTIVSSSKHSKGRPSKRSTVHFESEDSPDEADLTFGSASESENHPSSSPNHTSYSNIHSKSSTTSVQASTSQASAKKWSADAIKDMPFRPKDHYYDQELTPEEDNRGVIYAGPFLSDVAVMRLNQSPRRAFIKALGTSKLVSSKRLQQEEQTAVIEGMRQWKAWTVAFEGGYAASQRSIDDITNDITTRCATIMARSSKK